MKLSPQIAVVAALALAFSTTTLGTALEIGQSAGPVALTTLAGTTLEMKNYDERPATAVLFLSSRCGTTTQAMSEINKLHQKYRYRDVLFVGVFANPAESADEVRTFGQRSGIIFPTYRDADQAIARQFSARATPELFLLDRGGALVFHGGLHDADTRAAYDAAVGNVLRKQSVARPTAAIAGTPLDRPGPARELPDPYGTIHFESELIFDSIPQAPAHHCSTICEAGNGDLLCLWYGGSYESADDQVLFLARRPHGEGTWTKPESLLANPAQPPGNGVIFRGPDDRVWIVWCRMEGTRPMRRGSGWDRCRLFVRTSTDHGRTWSEDRPLLDETVWCVPRNPPITLAGGPQLLPVEGSLDGVEGSHFLALASATEVAKRRGFTAAGSQPAVVQRRDGSLLALLRHARHIRQIESTDGGQSWSEGVDTPLLNPDSGITMARLANGHLLLVYNDSQTKRTPLSVVRSTDEGKSWEQPWQLETNPGEYSYPCIIQGADGLVHVTYTFRRYAIKHVAFNEDWLAHDERPD